jgi:hypothetical protein
VKPQPVSVNPLVENYSVKTILLLLLCLALGASGCSGSDMERQVFSIPMDVESGIRFEPEKRFVGEPKPSPVHVLLPAKRMRLPVVDIPESEALRTPEGTVAGILRAVSDADLEEFERLTVPEDNPESLYRTMVKHFPPADGMELVWRLGFGPLQVLAIDAPGERPIVLRTIEVEGRHLHTWSAPNTPVLETVVDLAKALVSKPEEFVLESDRDFNTKIPVAYTGSERPDLFLLFDAFSGECRLSPGAPGKQPLCPEDLSVDVLLFGKAVAALAKGNLEGYLDNLGPL